MASIGSSVTIKSHYGDDIRRFQLQGADVTFHSLVERLNALYFGGRMVPLSLVYIDEDNDPINLKTDMDFQDAVRTNKLLKVRVATIDSPSAISTPRSVAAPLPTAAGPATPVTTPRVVSLTPLMPSTPLSAATAAPAPALQFPLLRAPPSRSRPVATVTATVTEAPSPAAAAPCAAA